MKIVVVPGDGEADEGAVKRLLDGDPPRRITSADRLAAIAALDEQHLDARTIAARLRINMRTVTRYRKAGRARLETAR